MKSHTCGPSVGQYWSPSSGTMSTATLLHHPQKRPRVTSRRLLLFLLHRPVRPLPLGLLALGNLPVQPRPVHRRQTKSSFLKPDLLQQLLAELRVVGLVVVVNEDRQPSQPVDVGLQVLTGHRRLPHPTPPRPGEPVPLPAVRVWKGRGAPALAFGRHLKGRRSRFPVAPLPQMRRLRRGSSAGHCEHLQTRTRKKRGDRKSGV